MPCPWSYLCLSVSRIHGRRNESLDITNGPSHQRSPNQTNKDPKTQKDGLMFDCIWDNKHWVRHIESMELLTLSPRDRPQQENGQNQKVRGEDFSHCLRDTFYMLYKVPDWTESQNRERKLSMLKPKLRNQKKSKFNSLVTDIGYNGYIFQS